MLSVQEENENPMHGEMAQDDSVPVSQAVYVTQEAADQMAQYGVQAGKVPENWSRRQSVVKPKEHYQTSAAALKVCIYD